MRGDLEGLAAVIRRHPVHAALAAVVWVGAIAFVIVQLTREPDPSVAASTVVSFELPGQRVSVDAEVIELLSGDREVPRALVIAAACQNLLAWNADMTLGTDLVIATDPAFARVGEMVDSGSVSAADAARFEQHRVDPTTTTDEVAFGGYLEARAVEASGDARARYVAFATNVTTTRWKFVLMDAQRFLPEDTTFFGRPADVEVQIAGAAESVAVPTDECDKREAQ